MKKPDFDFLATAAEAATTTTATATTATTAAPAVTPKPAKSPRKKGTDKGQGQGTPKAKKDKGDKGDKADSIWLSDRNVGRAFRVYCLNMELKIGATATDIIRKFLRGQGVVV